VGGSQAISRLFGDFHAKACGKSEFFVPRGEFPRAVRRCRCGGFTGVEFLFPYDFAPAEIVEQLKDHGLSQVLFNLPPGDWAKGDRGMAALPGRENEFLAGLERALEYAVATDCKRLHVMAGNCAGADRREGTAVYVSNLRRAGERASRYGITLLIEPLNKRDNPGYFLNTTAEAMAILREVGRDNLKLQLDLYHCQITEGDLAMHIRSLAGTYEHVQIAGVPGRGPCGR
jgi:2-dehydrotetronate isomerase